MKERSHISVVDGADTAVGNLAEPVVENAPESSSGDKEWVETEWVEEETETRPSSWAIPLFATIAILGWTAFYIWANASVFTDLSAQEWASLAADWSMPVMVILVCWVLLSRTATREAARYNNTARALSEETALLERRLVTVNRELSLAREFLSNQSRDLEYLGRSASERITIHAENLRGLIAENDDRLNSIAAISETALENMERLRGDLPVVANSAKDVSNQIVGAGRTARDQLGALVSAFERLNEFGEASERQVHALRQRVDEALSAFSTQAGQLETIANERFATLAEGSDAIRSDLQAQEIEALSALRARSLALRNELADTHAEVSAQEDISVTAMRDRMQTLRREAGEIASSVREGEDLAIGAWTRQVDAMKERLEATVEEIKTIDNAALDAAHAKLRALSEEAAQVDARIAERNQQFDEDTAERIQALAHAQDALAAQMNENMALLDEAIAARREAQRDQLSALIVEGDELGERVNALGLTFSKVAAQGHEAREALSGGIDALSKQLRNSREALDGTDQDIARLTDASVRLLELIQASAKKTGEDLPKAMEMSEAGLAELERRSERVHALLEDARATGEALDGGMETVANRLNKTIEDIGTFQTDFDGSSARQVEEVERLRATLASLASDSDTFAEQVQAELRDAIAALEDKAKTALASIEDEQAERISRLAEKIGSRSADAIDRALAEKTENALEELDAARARSNTATREMAQNLRDQLARLNDLTNNLEARVAHARDKATDTIDSDFARRVALITESLNSNSIDIAKALSSEVTDTAWASYLRGDRGIFTRRAVRLLDSSEAREIASIYDSDSDFRDHVNRYIHDFEAMLRTLLSTRDGNAVSVTLLSSDMGKLYVILAQALERLRQ